MLQVRQASSKLVRTLSAFSWLQRTIPTTERKWKVIASSSLYGGALPTAVSKMVTRMVRHYDQDERQPDAAIQWAGTAESVRKTGSTRFLRQNSASTFIKEAARRGFQYGEDSKNSLASFRAIQEHAGGTTIALELMEQILILYDWKEYIFHRGCSFSIQLILENGLIPSGKESEDDRLFSSHHSILSGKIPMKKNP